MCGTGTGLERFSLVFGGLERLLDRAGACTDVPASGVVAGSAGAVVVIAGRCWLNEVLAGSGVSLGSLSGI